MGGIRMRVLLVEDSARLQQTVGAALRRSGYAVDVSGDGKDGLWHAQSNDYDAIVLDIMLPGLDGLEVLRQIRAEGKNTPVLLLTILALLRASLSARWRWTILPLPPVQWIASASAASIGVAALLLSPQLVALAKRQAEGRMVSAPILWRSSPPGVDLISLLAPNPHHPLAPGALAVVGVISLLAFRRSGPDGPS